MRSAAEWLEHGMRLARPEKWIRAIQQDARADALEAAETACRECAENLAKDHRLYARDGAAECVSAILALEPEPEEPA